MGGIFQRPNRVRFLVKDLSNGKTFPILANEPAKVRQKCLLSSVVVMRIFNRAVEIVSLS